MINTLFLGVEEKITVIGDRNNYIAKSLFPCSIRILNRFGIEQDRFSNVTSNFSFSLPTDDLYKIEVTNGIYEQDVKIYSGFNEVSNINCFDNIYHGYFSSAAVLFSLNLLQIINNSKKSISCYGSCPTTVTKTECYYTDSTAVGTPDTTYYFEDSYNNEITDIPVSSSSIAASPAIKKAILFNSDIFDQGLEPLIIPVDRSLVFLNTEETLPVEFNFLIEQ